MEPWQQEEQRQLAYTARLMRRPKCARCDRRIWTDTYLDIDEKRYCGKCVEYCTRDTAEDFDMEDYDE